MTAETACHTRFSFQRTSCSPLRITHVTHATHATHATHFNLPSIARSNHGPRRHLEWCDPEEDGDRGQERAGAAASHPAVRFFTCCGFCAHPRAPSWQVIEAGTKVGENKAPAVFADIQKGGANLKKTETNDKSAPVIDQATKISEAPQSALFAEIAAKGQVA